jgi:hypothetical protein
MQEAGTGGDAYRKTLPATLALAGGRQSIATWRFAAVSKYIS